MRGEEKDQICRRGFAAEALLGVAAALIFVAVGSMCFAFGQHAFGAGLLAVAPWIIFLIAGLLAMDRVHAGDAEAKSLCKTISCLRGQQVIASHWSIPHRATQRVCGRVSLGFGGLAVATVYGLWQFQVRPSIGGGIAFLRSRLPMTRWLAGERVAAWGGNQLYLLLAAALLGTVAFGGLKASQALALGPALVVSSMPGGASACPRRAGSL